MDKDQIIELIEQGELFALCLETVQDDEDTYCIAGNKYEVLDYEECLDSDYILIDTEDYAQLKLRVDDAAFQLTIERE